MNGDPVTLSIDGTRLGVPKGTLIIRAAEQLGIEIPRFCDHPLLDPVAACRQCYVHIEGQPKLVTSCSTPVAEGMSVQTQFTNPDVKDAQESVLEFLLINHPLDCPICDRGGECPLQDQTLAFGPGESRYVEAKRTYRKPLALSPLVWLDRERCVLCQRCTRFCDQISGDRFIEVIDRGAAEQIGIAPGEDFASPFSGNTIQICPVGALTAPTYRFSARPFDVRSGDSICAHCSAGCNLSVELRRGEVVRHLARDNLEVNDAWLCDKGRFAFGQWDRPDRLTVPKLRAPGLEPVSFGEVLSAVAGWIEGGRVAFLAGGRLSDEDAFVLSKFARVACGTNDIDQRQSGAGDVPLAIEAAQASGMPVTYRDVEEARAILLVGLDAEQEIPILHLRIRKAARSGARVFVVHPRRTRLEDVAEHVLCRPGEEGQLLARLWGAPAESAPGRVAAALREAGARSVVLAGPRLAESAAGVAWAAAVASEGEARFAFLCRRANDRGGLRAGVHPALLPGGRRVANDDERAHAEVAWGRLLPSSAGRDTAGILRAAADREIDVLFLVGVDPLRDFPDAELARRALENVRHKVVIDTAAHGVEPYADAMLPAAAPIEREGRFTDWEGRSQHLSHVRDPVGMARPDWQILGELATAMRVDLGFGTIEDVRDEMDRMMAPGTSDVQGPAPKPATPEPVLGEGGDDVILFSYRLLVDEGRMSEGADRLKEALEQKPFIEVNPADARRLGLTEGIDVRIRTKAGEATLPARVTDRVAQGAAFVPYNQPGFAANSILVGRLSIGANLESAEDVGVGALPGTAAPEEAGGAPQ